MHYAMVNQHNVKASHCDIFAKDCDTLYNSKPVGLSTMLNWRVLSLLGDYPLSKADKKRMGFYEEWITCPLWGKWVDIDNQTKNSDYEKDYGHT